jgi:hypothetical protein
MNAGSPAAVDWDGIEVEGVKSVGFDDSKKEREGGQ